MSYKLILGVITFLILAVTQLAPVVLERVLVISFIYQKLHMLVAFGELTLAIVRNLTLP
jgi:hypothetical protein